MLTQERLKQLLHYNPDTGLFSRIVKNTNSKSGWLDKVGYRYLMVDTKTYAAHRLAWLYIHGEWPKGEIDHINGKKDDNRLSNIRDVDRYKNMQNERKARVNSSTGYLGVYYRKERNKWVAQLRVNGKQRRFGSFDNPEDAHQCYLEAKRLYHKGCTI